MENKIIKLNNELTLDSREVAKRVNKLHKSLCRDIRKYIEYITISNENNENKFVPVKNYFIEGQSEDKKGELRRIYLITQKGCELIAHKMTGKKGILFSTYYIEEFHRMQNELNKSKQENKFNLPQNYLEALKALVESEEEKQNLKISKHKQISSKGGLVTNRNYWKNKYYNLKEEIE